LTQVISIAYMAPSFAQACMVQTTVKDYTFTLNATCKYAIIDY